MSYFIEEFNINNRTAYLSGVDISLNANKDSQQPASCKSIIDYNNFKNKNYYNNIKITNVSNYNKNINIFSDINSSDGFLYINSIDGVYNECIGVSPQFKYTDYILLPNNYEQLLLSYIKQWGVIFYDSNKNIIGYGKSEKDHTNGLITIPNFAVYIRVNYQIDEELFVWCISKDEYIDIYSSINSSEQQFLYLKNGVENIGELNNFNYTDYIKIPASTYKRQITIPYSVNWNAIYYDNNYSPIGAFTTGYDIEHDVTQVIPKDAEYVRFNYRRYQYYYAKYSVLDELYDECTEIIDIRKYKQDSLIINSDNGKWSVTDLCSCALISVVQNETIEIKTDNYKCQYAFLKGIGNTTSGQTPHYVSSNLNIITLSEHNSIILNIPQETNYLYILLSTTECSYYPTLKRIGSKELKIINCIGDSITAGYKGGTYKWVNPTFCQIMSMNTNMIVNNYGISATSICNGSVKTFIDILNNMSEEYIDCLIIFGGTNDYGDKRAITLGNINDSPAQGTNFYASFKYLIECAINKYPYTKIAIITPMMRSVNRSKNSNGISLEDIVNAEIEVANYYGIPLYDFFHKGNINPSLNVHKTIYTTDGLHPNQLCVDEVIAPQFSSFVDKLLSYK